MTLVLLLVLAGRVAAPGLQTVAENAGAQGKEAAQTSTSRPRLSAGPFVTAPLELSRLRLKHPFRLAQGSRLGVGAGQEAIDGAQMPSISPRVVCTMRVVKADSKLDPAFVVRIPAGALDPIVRNNLSPCAQSR